MCRTPLRDGWYQASSHSSHFLLGATSPKPFYRQNHLIFWSWVMSKHMSFFKHEIPLDPIKVSLASDMYTTEWIMFITHFTLPPGSASGEILSGLMQSKLWIWGNWNIWPGSSACPRRYDMRDSGHKEGGQRHLSRDACAAEGICPSSVTSSTKGCLGCACHLS